MIAGRCLGRRPDGAACRGPRACPWVCWPGPTCCSRRRGASRLHSRRAAGRLADFRVAVWGSSPLTAIDDNVTAAFDAAVAAIAKAGAKVDREPQTPIEARGKPAPLHASCCARGDRRRGSTTRPSPSSSASPRRCRPTIRARRRILRAARRWPHRSWGVANEQRSRRCAISLARFLLRATTCCCCRSRRPRPSRTTTARIAGARRVVVNGEAVAAYRHPVGGARGAVLSAGDRTCAAPIGLAGGTAGRAAG